MITILRQNQRILMLVIAVLTIIAFVWLYNPSNLSELGTNTVAKVYDRGLSQADLEREARNFQLALQLGQLELFQDLSATAPDQNAAATEFIFNLLVLKHESKKLGVEPTDMQIADLIKALPAFQTSGQFDPIKYNTFVSERLGPLGFTQRQLEDVMRDSLRLKRVKDIVTGPVAVSQSELAEAARVFQKIDAQQIVFPLSAAEAGVTITDEEIKNFAHLNEARLRTPETRAVEYVEFALPASEASAQGRQKVEAQQKLADAASNFVNQASGKPFGEAAAAAGLSVKSTTEFDRLGTPIVPIQIDGATADSIRSQLTAFAPSAFALTQENSVSDVVQAGDNFYVLRLAKVTPERAMTLEEVKPIAESRLRAQKAEGALRESAEAALAKVREAMKSGKSFSDAATEAGLKVETVTGLAPTEEGNLTPSQIELIQAAMMMQPEQLSGFIPSPEGGFAVYLVSRAPVDETLMASRKSQMEESLLENKRQLAFLSWLISARDEAKITFVQRGQASQE